jgi:hypothetical protein
MAGGGGLEGVEEAACDMAIPTGSRRVEAKEGTERDWD